MPPKMVGGTAFLLQLKDHNTMRITQLTALNIKGQGFVHELAPVTMLHGRNWAGKTARLDALVLAIAGYLPEVGSRSADIYNRLASGLCLAVGAKTDTGLQWERSWTLQSNGSVKAINPEVEGLTIAPVAIDPNEFLSLSAANRIKFLFSKCTMPASLTVEGIYDQLSAQIKNINLENNTEDSEKAIRAAVSMIQGQRDTGIKVNEWLEAMIETVLQTKKTAAANVQRLEKTMQGLAQTALEVQVFGNAEQILQTKRNELEQVACMLHTAEHELARCREDWRQAKALAQAGGRLSERKQVTAKAARDVDEAQVKLGFFLEPDASEIDRLQHEAIEGGTAAGIAKAGIEASLSTIEALEKELEHIQSEKCCPKCKQSMAKLKPAMVKAQKAIIKTAKETLKERREMFEAQTKRNKEAESQLVRLLDQRTVRQNAMIVLEKAREAFAKAHALEEKAGSVEQAEQRIPELEKQGVALLDAVNRLKADDHAKRVEVQSAETAYKRLLASRAEEATRARTAGELEQARAELAIWKQVQVLLAELQGKAVEAAVGPLVNTANELCANLLKGPLALVDGELEMHADGERINYRTFSGTEKALAYAALSIALGAGSSIRIAMIDEVGRLDRANQRRLVEILVGLVQQGKLDQAVLIGTEPVEISTIYPEYRTIGIEDSRPAVKTAYN